MKHSTIQVQKELLSPPGDTIQETIDAIGMSQAELAERMGRPKEKLNDIIKGREPITLKTAILLDRVLGIPVSFWMERENEYRAELAKIEQQEFLKEAVNWLKLFPVAALKEMGWLPVTKDQPELVDSLLRFFGIAAPAQWNSVYLQEAGGASFKISLANIQSPHAISAWLRIGELKASTQKLPEFDKSAFLDVLDEIKTLVVDQPDDFKDQLQEMCARCGVAVLYTPCLPKAPISGATWWKGKNPIIQLSGRYKTNDSFWFAFYHEAAHIIKHGKKEIFLEQLEGNVVDQQKEEEANLFAQKYLFPATAFERLIEIRPINDQRIIDFASRYETHPGIVVGRLQYSGMLRYSQGNHLKVPIVLFE